MKKNYPSLATLSVVIAVALSTAGCRDRDPGEPVVTDDPNTVPATTAPATSDTERALEEGMRKTGDAASDAWERTKDAASGISASLSETWNELGDATYEERADLRQGMDRTLTGIESEIESWDERSATLPEAAREEWNEAKEDLQEARQDLDQELTELASASRDGWDEAREEVREAWSRVQDAYQRARTQIQQAD